MATITKMVDDLDGSDASTTVTFSVNGKNYTMDLSDTNASEFFDSIEKYENAATIVEAPQKSVRAPRGSGQGKTTPKFAPGYLDLVRAWARANGHKVADTGRIKATILEAYKLAEVTEKADAAVEAALVAKVNGDA